MLLLLLYLGILLVGLVLYTWRKPPAVSRPLYRKYIWFSLISLGVFAFLNYFSTLTPYLHALIAGAGLYEVIRALGAGRRSWWILGPATVILAGFVGFAFTDFPNACGVFLCVLSFDAFSQFTGQLLGRTPLWKRLSPGKTVEGSIGGLVVCMLSSLYVFGQVQPGLLIAVTALCGDLLASAIKRHAGLKDFSKVLPGQGGVLDRFDSYIFTCFVFYVFLLCQKSL